MTLRRSLTLLAASLGIVAAACSSNGAAGSGDSDIPVQDAELVAQGEPLYQASCASCHGADLRGTDKGPSHLSIVYEPNHHGDGAFVLAALRGVRQHHWRFGDMAPVPGLSEEDLEAIVAYVREQQRLKGFEPYPP
jgi:mono/diheme cytochrome c family protein